jgi:hypothetical protein
VCQWHVEFIYYAAIDASNRHPCVASIVAKIAHMIAEILLHSTPHYFVLGDSYGPVPLAMAMPQSQWLQCLLPGVCVESCSDGQRLDWLLGQCSGCS